MDAETLESTRTEMASRASPAADGYFCPSCNSIIEPAEVLEYLDWHVVVDLQGQL